MLTTLLLAALVQSTSVAQAQPPSPAGAPSGQAIFNQGACLDSPRPVQQVLQPPIVRPMQVVRIDKVVSTATMTYGEVIGFLYTTQDGATWLGQRTAQYLSPAQAGQINQLLAATHAPGTTATEFPPQTRMGVATKFQQYFKVQVPASALDPLHVRMDACVAWPNGQPLPDPGM
jgi:hypothetical protein